MNGSTEQTNRSVLRSGAFLFFAASVIVLAIVLITVFIPVRKFLPFLPDGTFLAYRGWTDWLQHFGPYSAGWLTMQNAINEFQAQPPAGAGWGMMAGILATLIITFAIAPVTFLWLSERMRRMDLPNGSAIRFVMRALTVASAVWCFLIAGTMIAAFWGRTSSAAELHGRTEEDQYRDAIAHRLQVITYTAQQKFLLPAEMGGGGMSFFRNGKKMSFRDLGIPDTSWLGEFVMVQTECDTIMKVLAVGNRIAMKPRWNMKGKDHVVEYELTLSPSTINIQRHY